MAAGTSISTHETPLVVHRGEFTLDPGSISSGNLEEETVAVPGVKVGDWVMVQPRVIMGVDILIQQAYVTTDGTIVFQLYNISGGNLDVASLVWDYLVIRGRNTNVESG